MATVPQRRATDLQTSAEIEEMIAAENDPKTRLFLMMLNKLNSSLMANTSTIREVSEKLDTHLTNYEAASQASAELINKGKGAWKVLAWVLGVAQVIVMSTYVSVSSDMKEHHDALLELGTRVKAIEARK